jgi:hypothetical protein
MGLNRVFFTGGEQAERAGTLTGVLGGLPGGEDLFEDSLDMAGMGCCGVLEWLLAVFIQKRSGFGGN